MSSEHGSGAGPAREHASASSSEAASATSSAAGASQLPDLQAEADRHLAELLEGLSAEQAAPALAVLANRVAVRLHNLARAEASARKGQAEWPTWAQLQNAARNLVLHSSTCRDLALRLTGQKRT